MLGVTCITVVAGAGDQELPSRPISTVKEELLVMVLLALTAPIRAVQKPCHEFHSHSHQLLFLRDVMAMYRATQNEVLPRNLLFPV